MQSILTLHTGQNLDTSSINSRGDATKRHEHVPQNTLYTHCKEYAIPPSGVTVRPDDEISTIICTILVSIYITVFGTSSATLLIPFPWVVAQVMTGLAPNVLSQGRDHRILQHGACSCSRNDIPYYKNTWDYRTCHSTNNYPKDAKTHRLQACLLNYYRPNDDLGGRQAQPRRKGKSPGSDHMVK